MMRHRLRRFIGPVCAVAMLASGAGRDARAADINVDLDGTGARESNVKLNVVSNYPAKVKNTINNKAIGQAFQFRWVSAGPGGFSSQVAPGAQGGVGAIWTWETSQSIFTFTGNSCDNDICFTRTQPNDALGKGPFSAPGRSLAASNVTVSNATLTSSLITFFSPPREIVRVGSQVEQLASGGFRYVTRVRNPTTDTITIDLRPGPLNCSTSCDEGETDCDGVCVDTSTDPNNCGECGVQCSEGQVCSDGECATFCSEPYTNCGGACVDTQTDEDNCGECGNACNPSECTYGAYCYFGTCQCNIGRSPGGTSPCEFAGAENVQVPPESVFEDCRTDVHPAKEVTSQLTACGPSIPDGAPGCSNSDPATQGPLNVFVPDLSTTIGEVFLTPYRVLVTDDPSGDGLIQPGETVKLKIQLLNAGSRTLTNAQGTLSSPAIDQTDDGTLNERSVGITTGSSPYEDIVGLTPTGTDDCGGEAAPIHPASNLVPFVVSFPADQPGDLARPFFLDVTGDLEGLTEMNVPIIVGIGSSCNPEIRDGDFDHLRGFLLPMKDLVLPGNDVEFPRPFIRGTPIPLKLRLRCANTVVGPPATPPEIVGLTLLGPPDKEIDPLSAGLSDHPVKELFFRYARLEHAWTFKMRTRSLIPGRYLLRIRMPNLQEYLAGFVLRRVLPDDRAD